MKIANTTCERVYTPLAVTNRHPRFSWGIESEEKNVLQSAYQIIVKEHTGGLAWDSGKVQSRDTYRATMEAPFLSAANTSIAAYVWLPLTFEKEMPVIRWQEKWSPEEYLKSVCR